MPTDYMSGFGNSFETEALPGALPVGRNSPQKVNYGLYAEQLSGSPFTAPQASNQRSWLYRIRPTVRHAGRFQKIDRGLIRTAPERDESELPIGQLRWGPTPIPNEKLTFVTGLCTITTAGDAETQAGMASHVLLVTESMVREHFFDADGELLVVAQENGLRFRTEFGVIDIEPGEICVIPRGVGLPRRAHRRSGARLCVRKLRWRLHAAGPRADRRELPRQSARFPGARRGLRGRRGASHAVRQVGRRAVRDAGAAIRRSTWSPGTATTIPTSMTCGGSLRSAPFPVRSSRSVDLHRSDLALGNARHRQHRLRDLSGALAGRREHVPAALVSPQHHVGVHGARLRRLRRQARGLRAGRHEPAQPDAAARARRRRLRARQQRRAQAGEADQHARLHVRDALPPAGDPIRGRTADAAGRLHRLLERPEKEDFDPNRREPE